MDGKLKADIEHEKPHSFTAIVSYVTVDCRGQAFHRIYVSQHNTIWVKDGEDRFPAVTFIFDGIKRMLRDNNHEMAVLATAMIWES